MIRILSKSKSLLYILFFCLCGNLIFGQTSGDYRSNPTTLSGTPSVYSWSDPLNWQYFNGSSWVTATSYPGENTGTGTVTIRDSHTITLSTSITKSFTSLIIGEGTSGQLFVSGDVSIQTTSVVIKPSGILSFGKNVSITFPVNTSFVVNSPGKIYATDTNCSNQTALYIGGAKVSACTGNGGGALSDFDVFNARGGTGATSNSPVCSGNQIVLTAIPPVTASNTSYTYTYQWSGRGIYTSGFVSSATYTISNADFYNHGGVYTVDIKRNDGVISTVTTNVVVNLTPVGGGISLNGQAMTCLNSSTGNMTLSGYVGNVLRWEKRLNNSSTWTSITNTANTYSENPSVAGTWDYRAVVGNAGCQEVNSSSFSMYVNPELTITLANANASICQNSTTATLSYTATTGNPVHYEINFDAAAKSAGIQDSNSDMSGTSGTLSMNVPYSVATGIYNGVVKLITYNPSCSSTRTFAFTLTVNSLATPTTITTQPVAPTATCSGNGTQTLTVVATGSSSLTYQWRKNGSPLIDGSVISGATANKLILTNPTTSDAGSYDVVISGNCASAVYSNPPVAVTVNSLTSITNQPSTATQTICLNGTANAISVIAAGSGLSYKWYSNSTPSNLGGALIATAISSNYTPPTTSVGSIYYYCVVSGTCGSAVTSTVSGEIKITPTVTINAFSPANHSRCQGAGTQTNTTTALNNSSAIVYSLDSVSSTAGNTIVGSTGVVTYVAGWSGTTTITASAAGCNGTATSTFVETITPIVTINAFSPASHTRCQGAGTQTNTTTALNNSSAIVYSLDTASNTAGNTIVGSTGVVTYVAGWSGTTTITASAAGCNGTATTTFVETITPTVTINAFSPASHTRCQGAGTQTNTTTALNNSSAIVYSLDTASSTAGNTIVGSTGVVTYVAGWSGTTTITASAAGCNGTATTTYIVTTNPSPTLTGASQASPICEGSSATINLTGLVINSTSTVNYTITGDAPQSVTVVADPSGNGNFTTRALTVANDNGRNLQITGITITSSTPNCPANFTQNVTLNVKPDSGGIRLNGGSPFAFDAHTTYCPNTTAVFSIDDTGAGAGNYHWTITTGSGWNLVSGQGSTSITVTTGTSIATISVVADNLGCPSYLRVTPTTIVTDPTQGTKTDVTCAAKGSVVLNNLPSGNRTLESILGGVTTTTSGTGLSATVTNLAAGTYTFKVRNDLGCISSPGLSVTILDVPTATWTGSAWVGGIGPDSTRKIVFAGPYDFAVTSSMDGCSCQVNAGVNVLVKKDAVLKLQNALEIQGVEGVDAGTLTFENTASLIQVNDDAVNTGKINYIRTTSPVVNFDYVYWSSPVADQVLNKFSPASDRYYSYATGAWVAQSGSNMMNPAGKGFIIRVPKLYTTTPQTFEFKGVPNNGIVGIDVETVKSNLIGNPYASALDADEFMDDVRNKDFINSALYFWTHNTKRTLTGSKYVYTSDDYALYNMTGGTGAAPSTDDDGDGIPDGVMPSGEIAAGQAFFVASNVAGKFYFDNSMRLSSSGSNGQFFRPSNTKKAAAKTKNRIWLNLTNDGGAFKQLLVGYIAGASNEVDRLYDGLSLNGNTYIDFYSVIDSKNYAIQGRGLPFDSADVVPLGYKTTIAGTFQISIDNVDGAMTNQAVYLEDKIANSIYDLKSGAYSFTTEIGTFNDRFVLRYTDGSKLGTGDFDTKGKGLIVSVKNSQIKINSFDQTISAVKIYDLKGSLLYEKNKVGINELIVDHLAASSQFMIVMTQLENGKWVSEEIIFHD